MSSRPSNKNGTFKHNIPAIYQNNFFELTLWTWCQAKVSEKKTISEAIASYRDHFHLGEDNAPLSTLKMIYYRKHNEFLKMMREEGKAIHFSADDLRLPAIESTLEGIHEILRQITKK